MSGVSKAKLRSVTSTVKPFFCILAFSTALLADPLGDVYARMDKTAQTFKSMTADIKQTVHTAVVNDNSLENGTIKLKRAKPGDTKILVNFTDPDPKTSSIDGREVRIYLPKSNVVQVIDIGKNRAAVDQAMLLGFGATSAEIRQAYEVTFVGAEPINNQPASHIKLIPKSKEVLQQLKQAELWISDALGCPLQQKLTTSAAGDYTMFTYSNIKLNASLDDKELRLNPKKGAQIQQVGK